MRPLSLLLLMCQCCINDDFVHCELVKLVTSCRLLSIGSHTCITMLEVDDRF